VSADQAIDGRRPFGLAQFWVELPSEPTTQAVARGLSGALSLTRACPSDEGGLLTSCGQDWVWGVHPQIPS
jgi:hypothetical protein